MGDLIAFLRDRLAEDEQTATAVFRDHTWSAYPEGGNDGYAVEGAHSGEPSCIVGDKAMANHIARHDPARVLREVEARRKMLHGHEPAKFPEVWAEREPVPANGLACPRCSDEVVLMTWPCRHVRLLALPYSDHPEYQEAWRP